MNKKCPDCKANARDWKMLAKEMGITEPTREEMLKWIRSHNALRRMSSALIENIFIGTLPRKRKIRRR